MSEKRTDAFRIFAIALCAALAVLSTPAIAQQPTLSDPLLDRLVGRWVLAGTIVHKPTTHDVDAEWVLNHQFVRIHEISREKADGGASPAYEAIVLVGWDEKRGQYVVHWTDVYGGGFSLVGHAPRAASSPSLAFEFDGGDGRFYTTFTYDRAADRWFWAMDNEQAGERREFARLSMSKAR